MHTSSLKFLLLMLALVAAGAGYAQELGQSSCQVRYISAEHVYLTAGEKAGLTIGSTAQVVREGLVVAELEVVFVASYSASCKVISSTAEVVVGDEVVFEPVAAVLAQETETITRSRQRTTASAPPTLPHETAGGPQVRGYLALQWDHSEQTEDGELQTNYFRLPFRVQVSDLGHDLVFRARGSLRRIVRTGYRTQTSEWEWRHRIQEVALVREGRDLPWHLALGRIGGRYTAAAGPFDGFSFNRRVATGLRLGAFAGFAPEWGRLDFQDENQLRGLTLGWNHQSATGKVLDLRLAGVGRYRESEVSREYLAMTTTWRDGRRLSLLQAAEVDINRGWRKDAGENSLTLSSLALTGRWRASRSLNLNLGFDDRQMVRTWENRSLPDSLFQDAGRRGLRAGLSLRRGPGRTVSLWGSLRRDDRTGQDVKSYNARLYLPRLALWDIDLDASLRGFAGPYLDGWTPTLGVTKTTLTGLRVRLEGGYFQYSADMAQDSRTNTWAKLALNKNLSRRWQVGADYRQDWGDDIVGRRWFLELRHRF